jgi:uncharacterized membrane protein
MKNIRIGAIILVYFLGFLMALHAVSYLSFDSEWGFLENKDVNIKSSLIWKITFYLHLIGGLVAIVIGPFQFIDKLRIRFRRAHRKMGKIYTAAIFLGGILSLYTSVYADGGLIGKTGFTGLGLAWLYTTSQAILYIKSGNISQHQYWMIRSYAVTLAAVSFRIVIGVLITFGVSFEEAYAYSSWLCWIINLSIAGLIINSMEIRKRRFLDIKTPAI